MTDRITGGAAIDDAVVAIEVPKLNNNDEGCVLREWLVESGARVEVDDVIAVLETSKSTFDLVSEHAGILHRLVDVGVDCLFGASIGYLFADEEARSRFLDRRTPDPATAPAEETAGSALTLTRGARELMAEAGLDEASVQRLGKRVVKRSDVEALLGGPAGVGAKEAATGIDETPGPAAGRPLTRRQQAIARTVGRSHREIPSSFVAVKVSCDAVLAGLEAVRKHSAQPVGLAECLVKAIAGLAGRFELFYGGMAGGGPVGEGRFVPAPEPAVGVTVDVGTGLFIPVLRDVASRSLDEIADALLELRVKAMRDSFRDEDLTGGAITLSINNQEDVLFAVPIVLPGQTAMVSLGSLQEEPALSESGELVRRRSTILGLAYDHRVVNGREAVEYLSALKAALERPDPLFEAGAEPPAEIASDAGSGAGQEEGPLSVGEGR